MKLEIQMNQSQIASLREFATLENRYNNGNKPTVFIIQTGITDERSFLQEIGETDQRLADIDKNARAWYFRTGLLESFVEPEKREGYLAMADQWMASRGTLTERSLPFEFENGLWKEAYKEGMSRILAEYTKQENNPAKVKNFLLLLFSRIENYFPKLFKNTRILSKFPKFVYTGICGTGEYFFLRLLSLCGCDVYCIHPEKTLNIKSDEISFHAQLIKREQEFHGKIPAYNPEAIAARRQLQQRQEAVSKEVPRQRQQTADVGEVTRPVPAAMGKGINLARPAGTRELSYEELAGMASSVVMIVVYNEKKEPYASGSGVLINNEGYILTNFHVVCGATAFAVRLEEEEEPRFTTELIKYHPENDLALIRVEPINRRPIPLCSNRKLVRGQKVVAIGSPLGLFNTVSDGIIAGFRKIEEVSMIQFTAPTSHGSSGGALLNLYGELIGIVTAGFDDGQNLNLAVDYETLRGFLRGFIN